MQVAYAMIGSGPDFAEIRCPAADVELLPNVKWGMFEATYTPANWLYLVEARKHAGKPINNKIGSTLLEEVCACLLGGYGIPAYVGLAAFKALKDVGAFNGTHWDEELIVEWLSQPMLIDGRPVKYRFAKQKAKYIAGAIEYLTTNQMPMDSGKSLRDGLMNMRGCGPKTAGWAARNFLDADDIAILDIHILRAGKIGGFLDPTLTVQKDYLKLEEQFIAFSNALGTRTSELDAEIWYQFSQYARQTHQILREITP
ncbi:MAG: 8-oxoguanine DNA glycosylase [Methylophilus sp.]|uniref:8-oxoguanine DNA glycosylase n=1 Tax=Methylophilus sp. TaxID=29541 RepID=UPI003F9FFD50